MGRAINTPRRLIWESLEDLRRQLKPARYARYAVIRSDATRYDAMRGVSQGSPIIHPRESCLRATFAVSRFRRIPSILSLFFSRQPARVFLPRPALNPRHISPFRIIVPQPTSPSPSSSSSTTWKQRQRQRAIKGLIDVNSKGN